MYINLLDEISEPGFDFFISMDCEGPIFDKNLKQNVANLEKFLALATSYNIYTILFITPKFADMLNELNLIEHIKNKYKVIFGLHIHPNDLPESIKKQCRFVIDEEDLIAAYSYEEQKKIIELCKKYIEDMGIKPLQGFRGGYFSMNNDTEKILKDHTNIRWESHNIYREEYKVTNNLIKQLPVYAFDKTNELRLEYFDVDKLLDMINSAMMCNRKVIATTHSYLLDSEDVHYKRDNVRQPIHFTLKVLGLAVNAYRDRDRIKEISCSNL